MHIAKIVKVSQSRNIDIFQQQGSPDLNIIVGGH